MGGDDSNKLNFAMRSGCDILAAMYGTIPSLSNGEVEGLFIRANAVKVSFAGCDCRILNIGRRSV